uniref:Phosphoinositide phospholipase C n=1 Tax=Strigamia maritima TaxID=126957 RepID=T1J420_STRMM
MNKDQAKDLFNKVLSAKRLRKGVSVINENEFADFYALLKERPELNDLFYKYSNKEEMLNPSQLLAFLQTEQKVINVNEKKAATFINKYEHSGAKPASFMSREGFQTFLLSEEMDIFNFQHRKVFQDMEQPLSFYYIASSHNTYLMADQIAGESSIEGYIRALKMGCRCVELDLWDGEDNEPIIYHGYTLTSKILLKDVLSNAIKTYSFATSEYPVILSLENHLSLDQQKILAKHLKTILGDMLYTQPIGELSNLPSPKSLKKKIIIKNKKLPPKSKEEETVSADSEDDDEGRPTEIVQDANADKPKALKKVGCPGRKKTKGTRVKLAQELSDLVNICTAVHFRSFDHAKKQGKWYEMSSLSEDKAYTLADSKLEKFVEYNRKQLIRIYPSGKRQDSSNYDPIPLWNVGSHMVALNYQTTGKYMMYNNAQFLTNGQCGYVLKPTFLVKGIYDSGMISSGVMFRQMFTIKVNEIISGQHLPRPDFENKGDIIDPYVIIKVRGHEVDERTFKTKVVQNNGFNPIWNEVFTFLIKVPQLAFVHFIVRDYSSTGRNEKLGEYCIQFENIQQGYRHVHLVDKYNRPIIPASIFVHVTIT